MFIADNATRQQVHSDRAASLHRAALPPATVDPPRRPRIRRFVGRSLVVLGVRLSPEAQPAAHVTPSRPVA